MKVCVDARMILTSGIGTVIQNFISNFHDEFDLILIGNPLRLEPFLIGKSKVRIIEFDQKIYSIGEQLGLFRKIPVCDIFWSPHYNIPLFPIRAKKRIAHIHDVFHLAFQDKLSVAQRIYAKVMISLAVRLSDKVITASEFSRSEILKHVSKANPKVTVIYNGVDSDLFRVIYDVKQLESVRVKYSLPEKFILYVGNVKPHKNLTRLIDAFSIVSEKLEDPHLVIVGKKDGFINGDPLLFNRISKNSLLSKRIIFTGYVSTEDLPYIYNLAKLFVFPSLYEGFGLPPLEAMACGCPVLASEAASMPEICGDAVKYFNPTDSSEMAERIFSIWSGVDGEIFVQRGFQRVRSFSWEAMYKDQVSLFHQILN